MMDAYFDESGMGEDTSYFVMAGYLASADKWDVVTKRWASKLEEGRKIDYFKMSEAAGQPSGAFDGFTERQRDAKLISLADILERGAPVRVACVIPQGPYTKYARPSARREFRSPYYLAAITVLFSVIQLCRNHRRPGQVQFYFDKQQGKETISKRLVEIVRRDFAGKELAEFIAGEPRFEDDKKYPPLQMADMLAWHIHRRKCRPKERKPLVYDRLTGGGMHYTRFWKPAELRQIGLEMGIGRGRKLVDLMEAGLWKP